MVRELLAKAWEAFGLNSKIAQTALGAITKPVANSYGTAGARQAVSQTVKEVIPSLGPYGGAIGAAGSNAFEERRP